jgi:hypothetical protein
MPRIRLEERHFDYLLELVKREVNEEAMEMQRLLSYTKHFKVFTVEIVENAKRKGRDNP